MYSLQPSRPHQRYLLTPAFVIIEARRYRYMYKLINELLILVWMPSGAQSRTYLLIIAYLEYNLTNKTTCPLGADKEIGTQQAQQKQVANKEKKELS